MELTSRHSPNPSIFGLAQEDKKTREKFEYETNLTEYRIKCMMNPIGAWVMRSQPSLHLSRSSPSARQIRCMADQALNFDDQGEVDQARTEMEISHKQALLLQQVEWDKIAEVRD